MAIPASLSKTEGEWTGEGTLVLPWQSPSEFTYSSRASIRTAARGFLRIEYTWAHEGRPHDGLILLTDEKQDGAISAVWIDSWHQSSSFMSLTGSADAGGGVSIAAKYPAPPGPEWGWRTVISAPDDGLSIVMYNISPEGEETLAVRNRYKRQT